ncbi:MAG TPA: murein biosynthesis integral membrane protein MurJ [Acidimicrobiales bacterium]|nr:murein biosynthesis integral membrane protein MurJ [Acidimicrobiales bacterium]
MPAPTGSAPGRQPRRNLEIALERRGLRPDPDPRRAQPPPPPPHRGLQPEANRPAGASGRPRHNTVPPGSKASPVLPQPGLAQQPARGVPPVIGHSRPPQPSGVQRVEPTRKPSPRASAPKTPSPIRPPAPSHAGSAASGGGRIVTVPAPPRSARPTPPPAPTPAPAGGDDRVRPVATLGRSTGVLAAGTFLSRLSGFLRVIVAALVLGSNRLSDAYNLANSIPNIVYDLLVGGVLSATLIPVFVDELNRGDRRERQRAISAVVSTIGLVLVILSVLLWVLAPAVMHFYLLLNHTSKKADELAVAVSLLRAFSPQVFLLGAIVVSTALLNARRQFAAAAFSPAFNNAIAIGALVATDVVVHTTNVAVFRHDHRGLLILGLGTTLGYLVQLLFQLPAMARGGLLMRPVWAPWHPAVRQVVGLSAWLIGVVVANQVSFNLIAVLAVKGAHHNGRFTQYQYAYQFFQLPYALFAVSIASAIMPELAALWSAGDRAAWLGRLISGIRATWALLLPAGIGMALVAKPVVLLALHHNSFHAPAADDTAAALVMFALGLPGFSVFLPLVRGLQAMKDTRAMFVVYALENALSVVLAFALYQRLGLRGLALAFIAPYTLAAIGTAVYIHRRVGSLGGVYTARSMGRSILATAVMAAGVLAVNRVLPHGTTNVPLIERLVVDVVVGVGLFGAVAWWLGVEDLQPVLRPIRSVLRRMGFASRPAEVG